MAVRDELDCIDGMLAGACLHGETFTGDPGLLSLALLTCGHLAEATCEFWWAEAVIPRCTLAAIHAGQRANHCREKSEKELTLAARSDLLKPHLPALLTTYPTTAPSQAGHSF